MTERLYYRDANLLEFDANAIEHAGDARHVVLDRTAFYPTSGGQPHDTGILGGARVIDVIDDEVGVVHVVDAPIELGPVHGRIDAARRRDHMQQHTAQHLVSAVATERFHWETVSVHFGEEHSTIEFDVASASREQLDEIERIANDVVAEARTVSVTFEDAEMVAPELRKTTERTGTLRIITIAGLDRSACGGTHVQRTSEIGPILLHGVEKVRNHVRVGFLAGGRALAHARASYAELESLAREMGCSVAELPGLVVARQREAKSMREEFAKLEGEVAVARIRSLFDATQPGSDGIRRIRHRASDESAAMLRQMAQAAGAMKQVLFVAISAAPPTIYFAASADSGVDAGPALKAALVAAGGKGGGSARVAQGTADAVEKLDQVAEGLLGG